MLKLSGPGKAVKFFLETAKASSGNFVARESSPLC